MWRPSAVDLSELNENRQRFGLSTFTEHDFMRAEDGRKLMTQARCEIDNASTAEDEAKPGITVESVFDRATVTITDGVNQIGISIGLEGVRQLRDEFQAIVDQSR